MSAASTAQCGAHMHNPARRGKRGGNRGNKGRNKGLNAAYDAVGRSCVDASLDDHENRDAVNKDACAAAAEDHGGGDEIVCDIRFNSDTGEEEVLMAHVDLVYRRVPLRQVRASLSPFAEAFKPAISVCRSP